VRNRIRELADGDELSDLTATPSNDTIHSVLSSSALPANIHHVVAVAAALLYPHHVPGLVVQIRGNPRIEHIRHLWEQAIVHRPPGSVQVRQARPRLLGVHAAIQIEQDDAGPIENELPVYVPRDLDVDLRAAVTGASQRGGFVLLTGGSSVGKTRALFEAVCAVLPQWWLVHPGTAEVVTELAATPSPQTVMWLDELQRYLNHLGGLPARAVRDLITAGVVVVATMWPEEHRTRIMSRAPGEPDPYANDRDLLGLAHIIGVPDTFSVAERRRAETLATDRRVRIALDTPDSGFTQTLAGGPELVRWWELAPADQCYGKAVITAALDARRVGAQAPLTRAFLEAAAPGYLTAAQQAIATADWLDHALAYATTPLHGAASSLTPVPAGMGRVAGYEVADYLYQHALRIRRTVHLPDIAWRALVDHHHPDDTHSLADNAERRGQDRPAEALYRQVIDVDASDLVAVFDLAKLLAGQGRVDDAVALLRPHTETGDESAAMSLAWLLAEHSRIDDAVAVLRPHTETLDGVGAATLADLLVEHGRIDDALAVLRTSANTGHKYSAIRLAWLLVPRHATLAG
jgi:hypothetical protein